MIFAREISDPLTSLVKKLDAEVEKQTKKNMAAFVVFLSDDDKMEQKVKDFAEKNHFKHVSFAVDTPAGPSSYKVAKDADVTVVLYKKKKVEVNHAFKKGEFTSQSVEAVLGDLPKVVAEK